MPPKSATGVSFSSRRDSALKSAIAWLLSRPSTCSMKYIRSAAQLLSSTCREGLRNAVKTRLIGSMTARLLLVEIGVGRLPYLRATTMQAVVPTRCHVTSENHAPRSRRISASE